MGWMADCPGRPRTRREMRRLRSQAVKPLVNQGTALLIDVLTGAGPVGQPLLISSLTLSL